MRYKTWTRLYLLFAFSLLFLFGLFNYTIDPLWTFCHSNRFNNAQPGFNERQQKTNRAYFCGLQQYDALLLGSSRTTYINQHDFAPLKVFNYASVSMYPSEYKGWIDQAKKIKGGDFKTIILGVDFFGSSNGPFAKQQMSQALPPESYLKTASSFLYRYKMLFTIDTLEKSLESIRHSQKLGTVDYTRDNVKQTIHISPERKAQAIRHQKALYMNSVYGKGYHYNTNLKKIFKTLKKTNPKTRFILFTTPINSKLFKILVEKNNLKDYKRWLRMLVEVFGEVYDFMGINSITTDPSNYADLHHIYPEVGTLLVNRIMQRNRQVPDDIGIRITTDNIDRYLKSIDITAKKLVKTKH